MNLMRFFCCCILILQLVVMGCDRPSQQESGSKKPPVQAFQTVDRLPGNLLDLRNLYVPVYSEIYYSSGNRKLSLTATLSIHNTSLADSLYVSRVDYFNTKGELLYTLIDRTALIQPLETVEFIIPDSEDLGGTGANFIVEWGATAPGLAPLVQCVMIGVSGAQGISFLTQGVEIEGESKDR